MKMFAEFLGTRKYIFCFGSHGLPQDNAGFMQTRLLKVCLCFSFENTYKYYACYVVELVISCNITQMV